ncbi:MAG: exodeoxyribonuclease V subunit alpha [Propionibacteriaceae bacterium]
MFGTESAGLTVAYGTTGLLRVFNEAGVLGVADVHTAQTVSRIAQADDEQVQLALGLTVRALRMGSVCIDLRSVAGTVFDESEEAVDVSDLPWPEPEAWLAACEASSLVTVGAGGGVGGRPLRLAHGLLYLERYWQQEEEVRSQLQSRAAAALPEADLAHLGQALARLFSGSGLEPGESDQQKVAAAVSALSWVTVVAGGPGTGKTTTVARLLALLRDQPGPPVRIALAAPTGKAAARLEEAVRSAAAYLEPADRERLGDLSAQTLHRLLGWLPGNRARFRHNAHNHLPFDVIVVDEMSMVSLTMMARLLEAVRPSSRLVLVGDPDQLSSVEAGAVLADITAAAGAPSPGLESRLSDLGLLTAAAPRAPVHGVVQLVHTWRYGGAIDQLARAIRASDPDATMAALRSGSPELVFADVDVEHASGLEALEAQVRSSGQALHAAAVAGDVTAAIAALDQHRLLCAHRTGPFGVVRWSQEIERWLTEAVPGYGEDGEWYLGRPLLVTANDYDLSLYNGDTGVVVETPDGVRAAFARGGAATLIAPVRLDTVQTMHAMTVHRAQGSQFACVSVIAPPPESPLLTRELLYTAATRATQRVQIFGSEEAIRRAVRRPANRASGLRGRLG